MAPRKHPRLVSLRHLLLVDNGSVTVTMIAFTDLNLDPSSRVYDSQAIDSLLSYLRLAIEASRGLIKFLYIESLTPGDNAKLSERLARYIDLTTVRSNHTGRKVFAR